jgi:crotonobetainyl-CoA:carnitine CoA-transferase CaiB-like acyl-CoA transferase
VTSAGTRPDRQRRERRHGKLLAGLKVIELARIPAGPWAKELLADLGAEVIKLERPGAGDDTRGWGAPFAADGAAAYLGSPNRAAA